VSCGDDTCIAGFAKYGFRLESFFPCCGLAEAVLFVTGATHGRGAQLKTFDWDLLEQGTAYEANATTQIRKSL
jgi:hypothetical protein